MSVFEELKARVIAGDTKVKPSDLANARGADELAVLQAQAAEREAREAEEAALKEARDKFKAEDYEDFMTSDLDPLREAYAEAVRAIAHLHSLTQERRRAQHRIRVKASKLGLNKQPVTVGLPGVSYATKAPDPEDAERWREQYVHGDYVERAVTEGKGRRLKPHVLHTDEVFDAIQALADAEKKAAEEHGRKLREALSGKKFFDMAEALSGE